MKIDDSMTKQEIVDAIKAGRKTVPALEEVTLNQNKDELIAAVEEALERHVAEQGSLPDDAVMEVVEPDSVPELQEDADDDDSEDEDVKPAEEPEAETKSKDEDEAEDKAQAAEAKATGPAAEAKDRAENAPTPFKRSQVGMNPHNRARR